MKKVTVTIMAIFVVSIFMLFSQAWAEPEAEEVKALDSSVYETAQQFNYDKFDKTWDACAAYSVDYADAKVVFGLEVKGNDNAMPYPPHIYVWIREANNTDPKWTVTGLQILVNEKVFTAKKIMEGELCSFMLLDTKVGKELLEEIAASEELEFKLIHAIGSNTEAISGDDYADIKHLAQLILDNDAWTYVYNDEVAMDMEALDNFINNSFPITIS